MDVERLAAAARASAAVARPLLIVALGSAAIAGCQRSAANAVPARSDASPAASVAAASPAARPTPAASSVISPLTNADVDLYLTVMRAAADRVAHATGQDKAAIDLARQVAHGATPTPDQATLLVRAADLAQADVDIAKARGVEARYEQVRGVVEGLIGLGACPTCSGDGGGPVTEQQQQDAAKEDAARAADMRTLEPHRAEIERLQKQVRGIMLGGAAGGG